MIEITVNGREYVCDKSELSYEEIIKDSGYEGNPSVTFRRAQFGEAGMLKPGESVNIVDGTIFNVIDTGNA